jgi:hypothetical protein
MFIATSEAYCEPLFLVSLVHRLAKNDDVARRLRIDSDMRPWRQPGSDRLAGGPF